MEGVTYRPGREIVDTTVDHEWVDRRDAAKAMGCCGKDYWYGAVVEICTRPVDHQRLCGPEVYRVNYVRGMTEINLTPPSGPS